MLRCSGRRNMTKLTKAQRSAAARKGWRTRWRNEAKERAQGQAGMYGYPHPSDAEAGRIQTRSRRNPPVVSLSKIKHLINAGSLSRKDGIYTARWGFFYTHGINSEKKALYVKMNLPGAIILDHGEHWTSFRGGASVANQSHWWVKFTL